MIKVNCSFQGHFSQNICEFAKLRAICAMSANVVYMIMCYQCAPASHFFVLSFPKFH